MGTWSMRRGGTRAARHASAWWVAALFVGASWLWAAGAAAQLTPERQAELRVLVEGALTSEQNDVRRMAVLALGAMVDAKDLKDFRKYLKDADPVVQRAALVALALRGDKEGLAGIEKALAAATPDEVDRAIAELLQPLPEATQLGIFKKILNKPASETLRTALFNYIARERSDEAYELLGSVTRIKDVAVRDALVDVLIAFPRPAGLPVAQALYKAKDAPSRLKALDLARAINDHDAQQQLAGALKDPDDEVRSRAENLLLALAHPAIVPLLEQRVRDNPKDAASIALLTQFDPPDLMAVLLPLVENENPALDQGLYNQVMALIASAKTEAAKKLVQERLASTYEADRIAAAHAIGFTADRAFTPDLLKLVFDGSVSIRRAAARSFGGVKDPAALETMNKALSSDNDPEVKLALVRSMGEVGDPSAANHLQFLMTHRDNALRAAALDALVQLKALGAATAIEYVTQDADPGMRWRAVVSLFLIDPIVYGDRLRKAVPDAPEDLFFETLAQLPTDMRARIEEEVLRGTRATLAKGLVDGYVRQGPAGLPMLRKAFDVSPDRDVKVPALQALARAGEPEDLDRLKTMANDTDRALRLTILRTLLKYDPAKTEDIFSALTTSDDPLFQVVGIYGLVKR